MQTTCCNFPLYMVSLECEFGAQQSPFCWVYESYDKHNLPIQGVKILTYPFPRRCLGLK